VTDLAFGVLLVTAGAAFVVYSGALGKRAQARGARFGRELYVVAGVFLVAFGLTEIARDVLF
jgi:sulfite exporter TauE/SafE